MADTHAVARALDELASLLELQEGANVFRARAYRKAARSLLALSDDLDALIRDGRLTQVPGVGKAIAAAIEELARTGSLGLLESLRAQLPPGAAELARIPGLTLERIQRIHDVLGVSSIEELREAAEAGRLRTVPRFGEATERKLLHAIRELEHRAERLLLSDALREAALVVDYLSAHPSVTRVENAGEARRFVEVVPAVRVVAGTRGAPSRALDHFERYPPIESVVFRSKYRAEARLAGGTRVELAAVPERQFPVALFVATGSEAHVADLRAAAARAGADLLPDTIDQVASSHVHVADEAELYELARVRYVPPELREGVGEVVAARGGRIPTDLVTLEDVRGLVHCHTTYSDGKNSVLEMARAADELGMEYITITDHSPTASYAGGLDLDQLKRQWDEIAKAQEQVRVRILRGTESDILADGSLDYPDSVLEQLDVVIASVHNRYKMDEDEMTKRVVAAMRHPVFKIWGHALGRLLERRPPIACRVEEILDAIAESRAAIEVNGDPHRLDLEPRWIREARKRGLKFVLSTDAHSVNGLENVRFAVGIGRRGGLRRRDVLNTRRAAAFARAVRPASVTAPGSV